MTLIISLVFQCTSVWKLFYNIFFRFVTRREHRVNSRKKGLASLPPDPRVRVGDWSPRIIRSHHRITVISLQLTIGTRIKDNDKMAITWRDRQVVWAQSTHSMKVPATVTEHFKKLTFFHSHNLTKKETLTQYHFTLQSSSTPYFWHTAALFMYILSFNYFFYSLTIVQRHVSKSAANFWQK